MKRTNSVADALNDNAADLDIGDGLIARIPLGDVGAKIEAVAVDAKTYTDGKVHRRGEATVAINELRSPGVYWYRSAALENNPFPGKFIIVEVRDYVPFGTAVIQTAYPNTGSALPAVRSYTGTTWTAWDYSASAASISDLRATVDNLAPAAPASGTKVVPLAVTAAQGPFKSVMTNNTVRWVRRWAVAPTRIRIHIANLNPAHGVAGGAVTLTGIWVGAGATDGSVATSSRALGPTAIPNNGAEVVTPWINNPARDGEHLAITTAWFAAAGTEVMQMQGGGWVSSDNTTYAAATTAGWTRVKETPFHVWVEAEVSGSTPVICGHGDSITIGTAATDPVGDSFIAEYALKQGALPVILAEHGSTMNGWNLTPRRWTQYKGVDLTKIVDATITTMGQNDLAQAGITVQEMKTRHQTMMPLLRQYVGGVIYTGFLTPSSKPADVEVVRREYNAWLTTLPTGARGVFDFAAAVGTPDDEALAPQYSADGLHPNTAGQKVMAEVVEARPVTPFVLPPSKLKALAALL